MFETIVNFKTWKINELVQKFSVTWIQSLSNASRIFRLREVRQMFGGPIFREWNEIFLLGKVLKFGVIFQKYALKLIKIWKIIEKIREKMQIFPKIF